MSKLTHQNHAWRTRSASYSTHGSRNGVNLLGWTGEEHMTPEQERSALAARAKQLQKIFTNKTYKRYEKEQLVQEYQTITKRINELRPKLRTPGIEQYVFQVLQETLTKTEYDRLINEAKRRYAAEINKQQTA